MNAVGLTVLGGNSTSFSNDGSTQMTPNVQTRLEKCGETSLSGNIMLLCHPEPFYLNVLLLEAFLSVSVSRNRTLYPELPWHHRDRNGNQHATSGNFRVPPSLREIWPIWLQKTCRPRPLTVRTDQWDHSKHHGSSPTWESRYSGRKVREGGRRFAVLPRVQVSVNRLQP